MNRIRINLAVFALLSTATIAWSIPSLCGIERLTQPITVTAEFQSSPGLAPGFEVSYLGKKVGNISAVELEPGRSVVTMKLDNDVDLPASISAAARRRSAIGEPYIDLFLPEGTDVDAGPRLDDDMNIPVERTTIPISYADLFASVSNLVEAVDPEQLATILDESATALAGRGDDLRRIVTAGTDLTDDLVVHADDIDQLIDDLGTLAGIAADNADTLVGALDSLQQVTDSLTEARPAIDDFLADVPPLVRTLDRIIVESDGALLCTLDGLSVLQRVATPDVLDALSHTLQRAPELKFLLDDIIGANGFADFSLQLTTLEVAEFYDPKPAPPVVPDVPACAPFANDASAPGEASRAGLGNGGTASGDRSGVDVDGRPPAGEEARLAGSSALGPPEEPFLARVLDALLPALAGAMILGGLWYLVAVMRRRAQEN